MAAAKPSVLNYLFPPVTLPDDSSSSKDNPVLAVFSVLAICFIGHAVQMTNGMYYKGAIAYVFYAMVALGLAFGLPRTEPLEKWSRMALPIVILVGVVYELGQMLGAPPLKYMQLQNMHQAEAFHFSIAALAVLTVAAFNERMGLKRWHGVLMLLVFLFLGAWLVEVSPKPNIDVIVWHREGIAALLRGDNPYSISIPNIYNDDSNYPGAVKDGRVMIGYVYPPINLLLCVLGHIFGDCRYALSAAIAAGGACLMAMRRNSGLPAAAIGLLMLTPRGLFSIENAWIEPFAFMFLCVSLYLAARHPRYLPVGLGLLFVCKQYMPVLAPAVFLLPAMRGPRPQQIKQIIATVVVGSVVTLPFILWSPADFWKSVVDLHLNIQFRADALTYLAYWQAENGWHPSSHWSFVAALAAGAVVWWRAPRTASGMAFAMGFVFLVFIAFNRQAFCNYYWLVMGFLTAGIALCEFDAEPVAVPAAASGKKSKR